MQVRIAEKLKSALLKRAACYAVRFVVLPIESYLDTTLVVVCATRAQLLPVGG
jgi:hypothetical protein